MKCSKHSVAGANGILRVIILVPLIALGGMIVGPDLGLVSKETISSLPSWQKFGIGVLGIAYLGLECYWWLSYYKDLRRWKSGK